MLLVLVLTRDRNKEAITDSRKGVYTIILVSLVFIGVAYMAVHLSATSATLPQTQFPDFWITRPYDMVPLVLFLLAAPLFWYLTRENPSLFTAGLLIDLIPEVMLEAHMAFGSSQLFDNNFNIAHGLKIVAYLIPFIGLLLDYVRSYELQIKTTQELDEREGRLKAVLDGAADGIIAIDVTGEIKHFNSACERMFGYCPDEVIGQNIKMLMPEPYHGAHDGYLEKGHA